jgi:transcriptional regulator with XRE-family HTH domain
MVQDALDLAKARRRLPPPGARKLLRQLAGLPQQALADELRVARPTISRWERGLRQVSGPHVLEYAALLERMREEVDLV